MFKWAKLFHFRGNDLVKTVESPDGRTVCEISLKNGELFYRVLRDQKPLVKQSKLGFSLCGEKPLGDNLKLVRSNNKRHDEIVELDWGEDRYLSNKYREKIKIPSVFLRCDFEYLMMQWLFVTKFRHSQNSNVWRWPMSWLNLI